MGPICEPCPIRATPSVRFRTHLRVYAVLAGDLMWREFMTMLAHAKVRFWDEMNVCFREGK